MAPFGCQMCTSNTDYQANITNAKGIDSFFPSLLFSLSLHDVMPICLTNQKTKRLSHSQISFPSYLPYSGSPLSDSPPCFSMDTQQLWVDDCLCLLIAHSL